MDYFKQECIIYKDLKASHVFIKDNLRVELIDLGLAEQISDGLSSVAAGTCHSMSPEMSRLYLKQMMGKEVDY